jgi:hypothetical protein
MGVPVVFHHVADQPHTSSPHFASFPHGLPDHRFMLQFVLPAHPQDHEPSISSTISLPICEPIFISPTSYRNSPMGPPPFIVFTDISALPGALILHWGTRFCILYIFPKFIHYSLYKHLYFQPFPLHLLLSSPLATFFPFWPHATHVTLGWSILLIYPRRHRLYLQSTTQVTYHLSSEFVHLVPPLAQLIPGLVVPLTLDLVTRLRPLFLSYILQPRAVLSHPTF